MSHTQGWLTQELIREGLSQNSDLLLETSYGKLNTVALHHRLIIFFKLMKLNGWAYRSSSRKVSPDFNLILLSYYYYWLTDNIIFIRN